MKFQLMTIAVIALMLALPFVTAAQQQGNEILPVEPGFGDKLQIREQLREKFLGDESYRTQLRERIVQCVGDNSTECQEVKEEMKEVAKGVMNKVCNNYDNIMARVKDRIDKNPRFTGEEKEALKDVIDEQADKFEDLCAEIEDATPEELKELAQKMRPLMKETKIKLGIAKDFVHAKRVGLVLERAEHLETKLQDFIEKWNVTNCSIENLTDEFNAKIAEAREAYNESVDLWQQFKESVQNHEPNTELLREAQAKMQLAQLKLKEAHVILKEIIVELRECRQIEKVESNETEEPEEQEENESE